MASDRKQVRLGKTRRSAGTTVSAEESLKRMREFRQRKGAFVASIRKGKNRGVSA